MADDVSDHLIQRIWALSSLGLVKSRGTPGAIRIWAVATCVFNIPLLFSREPFLPFGPYCALYCCVGNLCGEVVMQKGSGGVDEDGEH